MKKNFVKKLALGLAFTVAVGSVPATNVAAAEATYPSFKSVTTKENRKALKVGQTKKYYTKDSEKWALKRINVGNDDVATARFSRTKKFIKVTGVSVGQTQVRAVFKNYKTKEVYKGALLHVDVKAVEQEKEEPVVVAAELASVTQTASNAFTATFTADASQKFTKENFTITAQNMDSTVVAVKDVAFSADGLSATVTVYGNFENGTTYNIACDKANIPFTAVVGEVAKVVIHTASAQQNVATAIEYSLYDASGIDVTPSINKDSNCIVTVSGAYSGADLDKASAAKLTMDTVGSTAEVTVIYNSNEVNATNVEAKATIVCVDAKAVMGNKLFVTASKTRGVNNNSGSAKFYLGLSDSDVKVPVDGTVNDLYFCAKDASGNVISYDEYTVESNNEDVMTVSVNGVNSGKYAVFTVDGNSKGSAQITVAATKNGKTTYYTIPVTVANYGVAVKMDVTVSDPVMSNVEDSEYTGDIDVALYDILGNEVEGTATFEVLTKVATGTGISVDPSIATVGEKAGVSAQGVQAKTYTIKVTAADNKTGDTFVKNVNVSVKNLNTENNLKLTYQIETLGTTVDQMSPLNYINARLYATYNGLFAGYVREVGGEITVAEGNVNATDETRLVGADVLASFGREFYQPGVLMVASGAAIEVEADAATPIGDKANDFYTIVDSDTPGIIYKLDNKGAQDSPDLAKTGRYVVQYNLTYDKDLGRLDSNGNQVVVKKTLAYTVKNSVFIPSVKVTDKVVDSFDIDGVKEVLVTDVDMNNNDSDHESIEAIWNTDCTSEGTTSSDGNKFTVKYAVVNDNYGDTEWYFYIPINTTFRQE